MNLSKGFMGILLEKHQLSKVLIYVQIGSHCIANTDLKLVIHLSQPPKYWDGHAQYCYLP